MPTKSYVGGPRNKPQKTVATGHLSSWRRLTAKSWESSTCPEHVQGLGPRGRCCHERGFPRDLISAARSVAGPGSALTLGAGWLLLPQGSASGSDQERKALTP